jgi:AraC-like DNA-binding protein
MAVSDAPPSMTAIRPAAGLHRRFMGAGRLVVGHDWAPQRHSHPFTEMMVMLSGTLSVEIAGQSYRTGAGEILHYPPGAAHLERVAGRRPAEFIFFSFDSALRSNAVVGQDGRGRMRLLASWLHDEAQGAHELRQGIAESLLAALLAEFERAAGSRSPTMADRVRAVMKGSLAEHLTVEALAREASMSRAHFIRSFKRMSGRTPMAELRQLRVEAARDLVIATELPLKSIAARVGLQDEIHLSHVFRRVLGVAPGYFRTIRS